MAVTRFEGWKILFNDTSCGFVKFYPKKDSFFSSHATVDVKVTKRYHGRHIGRIALQKAILASDFSLFVAHLSKVNVASKKVLLAVGFKEAEGYVTRQACMTYKKA